MEKISELLFENKMDLPDGLYVQLMNACKIVNDTPSGLYKLEYFIINTMVSDNKNVCIDIEDDNKTLKKFTKIININDVKESRIIDCITKEPFESFYELGKYTSLFPELISNTRFLRSYHIIKEEPSDDSDEDDDECCCCEDDIRKIKITIPFTCFKYALVYNVSKLK